MYLFLILLGIAIGLAVVLFRNRVPCLRNNSNLVTFIATLIATFVGVFAAIYFAEYQQHRQRRDQLLHTLTLCVENLDYYKGSVRNIPVLFDKMREMPQRKKWPTSLAEFIQKNPLRVPDYLSSLLATERMSDRMSPESFTQLLDSRASVVDLCESVNEAARASANGAEMKEMLELYVLLIANLQQVLFAEQKYQEGGLTLPEIRHLHMELAMKLAESAPSVWIERDRRELIEMGSATEAAAKKSMDSDKK